MPDPKQDNGRPIGSTTQRSHPPWPVVVAGILGLAAAVMWLMGTYYFWYYHPLWSRRPRCRRALPGKSDHAIPPREQCLLWTPR